jgi:hypothetical protein
MARVNPWLPHSTDAPPAPGLPIRHPDFLDGSNLA